MSETLICMNCGHENEMGRSNCKTCRHPLVNYEEQVVDDAATELPEDIYARETGIPQRRPWIRNFARSVDYYPFSFIASFLITPILEKADSLVLFVAYSFLFMISCAFVEALFLSKFGTTPGKWLFSITVKNSDGENLTYQQALKREILVLYKGMGFNIPIVSFVTMWNSHDRLLGKGRTSWDAEGNFIVRHQMIGSKLVLILIVMLGPAIYSFYQIFRTVNQQ